NRMGLPAARRRRGRVAERVRRFPGALLALLLFLASPGARAATYSVARFSDTAVVTGLNQPTDFAFLPDGRILILERPGRVMIVGPSGGAPAVAADLTPLVEDNASERGLLGICLHPDFATNGYVFLYFTTTAMSVTRNRISRFTMTGSTISAASEAIILDNISSQNGNHNGGTILIGPDGKLWAAPGDSGTGGAKAQNLSPYPYEGAFSGKVLRMELDGSPAAGNPYLSDATKEPRIWAYGFRNPFRFSFRPSNGSLYLGDVGQSTREELDVGVAGGNFGWPYREGTVAGPGGACPMTTTCLPPVFDYGRTVGTVITGGVFVTGNAYPTLQGKYVFADYGSSWIKYLEFNASDALVGGLQDLATAAEGPVAFHQGPDGNLYYAAINTGRIYRVNYSNPFYTLAPCRILDTREAPGPYGGPALAAGAERTFVLGGRCGISPTARAVSVNLGVTQSTAQGHLTVLPAAGFSPSTSAINFRAGQTRANNAIVTLGPGGEFVVRCIMPSGGVHFFLDVNGYFE
ncbi:MAG TPA: PQQ-dependent sugar dehydrogenase, partial [Thermoanaerobaculia bacterium]|nr:PQQ-dependent sugar dehydrogenase [Thermoanaerobaculia bacterium]